MWLPSWASRLQSLAHVRVLVGEREIPVPQDEGDMPRRNGLFARSQQRWVRQMGAEAYLYDDVKTVRQWKRI